MAAPKTARRAPRKAASATKPTSNAAAWSFGTVALAASAGLIAFLTRGRIAALLSGEATEGHVPTDLLDPERNADDRAIADFRPDMSASMSPAERAALAPATDPSAERTP